MDMSNTALVSTLVIVILMLVAFIVGMAIGVYLAKPSMSR